MRRFTLVSKKPWDGHTPVKECDILVRDAPAFMKFVQENGPWPVEVFDQGEV